MTAGVSRAHPARQIAAPAGRRQHKPRLPAARRPARRCGKTRSPPRGRAAIPWSTCAHTATPARAWEPAKHQARTGAPPGTRTPNPRIKRAQGSGRTTCTDATDWCSDGTHFTCLHKKPVHEPVHAPRRAQQDASRTVTDPPAAGRRRLRHCSRWPPRRTARPGPGPAVLGAAQRLPGPAEGRDLITACDETGTES